MKKRPGWFAETPMGLRFQLEAKLGANPDLACGIRKVAVGIGYPAEWSIRRQRRRYTRAADDVPRVVNARNVYVVRQVKGLTQHLQVHPLSQLDALRQPRSST